MPGFILVDLFGRRRLIGSPDDLFEDRDEGCWPLFICSYL